MKQFFLTMARVFAGLLVFFVVVPIILISTAMGAASAKEPVHARSVLELDLRVGLTDQAPNNPFASFVRGGLAVVVEVQTLDRAEVDDRIKVVLICLPEGCV